MAFLCGKTDKYNLYKLKIVDLPNGEKKICTKQPEELDHIEKEKYHEIIKIINEGIQNFYQISYEICCNAFIYIVFQVIVCMYVAYMYFTKKDYSINYLIFAIVLLSSNILLPEICAIKLSTMIQPIINRINRNIEKYSKKNDVPWKFEILLGNTIDQIYLKYYIYRQEYDPPDPLNNN